MKTLLVGAITASLLAAVVVSVVSLMQTPTYEASARVLVDQKQEEPLADRGEAARRSKRSPLPAGAARSKSSPRRCQ